MPACKLCHQRDADKTGSHIVPFFLMRTVDNADNRKERNMELGFELGKGHVKGYFGGSVLPERLEPVFGEISDEDIANSRSSMIVDHMFCSACETRLGKLEGFYATTLDKNGNGVYRSTEDSFHALLFWISVFWRLSAVENKAYHLSEIDEYHLRIILDGGLDAVDVPNYIQRLGIEVTGIRYRIIRSPGYVKENPGWAFMSSDNTAPYCFLIGEFVVLLYMDNMDTTDISQSFLYLEKEALAAPLNDCQNGEDILPISADRFATACEEAVIIWKDDFLENIEEMCDLLHDKFVKMGTMDPKIKQSIVNEISADDKLLGRQYSIPGIVDATTKVLIQHEPYRSIAEGLV